MWVPLEGIGLTVSTCHQTQTLYCKQDVREECLNLPCKFRTQWNYKRSKKSYNIGSIAFDALLNSLLATSPPHFSMAVGSIFPWKALPEVMWWSPYGLRHGFPVPMFAQCEFATGAQKDFGGKFGAGENKKNIEVKANCEVRLICHAQGCGLALFWIHAAK